MEKNIIKGKSDEASFFKSYVRFCELKKERFDIF